MSWNLERAVERAIERLRGIASDLSDPQQRSEYRERIPDSLREIAAELEKPMREIECAQIRQLERQNQSTRLEP